MVSRKGMYFLTSGPVRVKDFTVPNLSQCLISTGTSYDPMICFSIEDIIKGAVYGVVGYGISRAAGCRTSLKSAAAIGYTLGAAATFAEQAIDYAFTYVQTPTTPVDPAVISNAVFRGMAIEGPVSALVTVGFTAATRPRNYQSTPKKSRKR
jgi:hypothetical protein